MNNELMDMVRVSCDERVCAADEARIEYERGVRERGVRERAEAWAAIEAAHGPLHGPLGWWYSAYDSKGWKD